MTKTITRLWLLAALCLLGNITATAQKYVGGDISLLPTYEEHGVIYKDYSGNNVDALSFFKDQGWNAIRLRLFVDPSQAGADDRGEGVVQDLGYIAKLAKRVVDKGFKLMLDFHYSDTWTDPGQHSVPARWLASMEAAKAVTPEDTVKVLADSVYAYTKECLEYLKSKGITPDFIQPGNEITYGMLWPTGRVYANGTAPKGGSWSNFVSYLKNGIKAIKEVCPNAKIVIQTEMGNPWNTTHFYDTLGSQVDYDIIGFSYYPDWHGPISSPYVDKEKNVTVNWSKSTLSQVLSTLEKNHADKKIMIVETGYEQQYALGGYSCTPWSRTDAGQKQFVTDLIAELKKHANVNGLFWWMPEDNEYGASSTNQARSSWWNASLFWQNSGWPTSALKEMKTFAEGSSDTGISSIPSSDNPSAIDRAWYTLSGTRLPQQPTAKGIYIHGGKKVVK